MKEIRANTKKAKDTEASLIAETPIKTIPWSSSIAEANREMIKAKFMRLPVTNQDGRASGILSMEDVALQLFFHLQNMSSENRKL